MKKFLVSIMWILIILISGCSFNEEGNYTFYKIKYKEDGISKETDCVSTEGLPIEVASACNIKYNFPSDYTFIKIENGVIYMNGIDSANYKYIIENGIIKVKVNEESEYTDSYMKYSFGKIYFMGDNMEYIFKK